MTQTESFAAGCADMISRRHVMTATGGLFAWSFMPRFAFAGQQRDPRFLTIILRGAMDGLSAVAPLGDPDYLALRESIALSSGGEKPALSLDGFFALHPSLINFSRLYAKGEASVIHAVATPYRERSHFDGQDCLESGYEKIVANIESGWLNRALQVLPKGSRVSPASALSVSTSNPIILRGSAPVMGWAPPSLPRADEDMLARVLDLYAAKDRRLFEALAESRKMDAIISKTGMGNDVKFRGNEFEQMKIMATGAARLLSADDGPRIAALSFHGWDTHANEGGATGRLAQLLTGLDNALLALEQGMQAVWKDTSILIVTEFGRTAKINGTVGTDHGTATVAFLVGGAVKGGRIIADWPGLKTAALYEGRDLQPTTDLRSVAKSILKDQWGLSEKQLSETVFPGSAQIRPLAGLIA